MADLWRVTYMGEGVKPTEIGAFAKYVTAFTTEEFAKSVAGQSDWVVADPSGAELGGGKAAAPKQEKKAEEKKPAAEEKKPEKAEDKKPAEKKADEKPAEKAEEKKPAAEKK